MTLSVILRSLFGSPAPSDVLTEVAVVDRSWSYNLLFCKKPIEIAPGLQVMLHNHIG